MEETIAGPATAHIPKRRGDSIPEAAVRYVEERHWDVFPGTWLEVADGTQHCSCGEPACPAPGAHPAHGDWATQATGSATVARGLWSERPTASILLPVGRTFDAIDVPETAGLLALARMERMGLTLGPVILAPDRRMQFFVLPGAAAKVPHLLRQLGWPPSSLDLVALGEGTYVAAPPTRYGSRGAAQWVCRPTSENRWLPDAEALISSLAYACARDR
ncbi:bifunctional DNA primase/polymerase [Streptomyces sp. NPDC001020]